MRFAFAAALVVSAACEAQAPGVPDAPPRPDAPTDAMGTCAVTMTGDVVDWDSGATAAPVAGVKLTDRDTPALTATSGADGAFAMCLRKGNFALVDVTPAAGSDALPVTLFANDAAIEAGGKPSVRMLGATRRDAFFTAAGGTYDPNAGQVLVHFTGPANAPHKAAVGNTPGIAPQAYDGTAWTASDTGLYVFFGNVALGTTANTLVTSDAPGVVGTAFPIPLTPGAITYLELFVP